MEGQLLFERHPHCPMVGEVDGFCPRRDRFEVLRKDPIEVQGKAQQPECCARTIERGLKSLADKHVANRPGVTLHVGKRKNIPHPANIGRIEVSPNDHRLS